MLDKDLLEVSLPSVDQLDGLSPDRLVFHNFLSKGREVYTLNALSKHLLGIHFHNTISKVIFLAKFSE